MKERDVGSPTMMSAIYVAAVVKIFCFLFSKFAAAASALKCISSHRQEKSMPIFPFRSINSLHVNDTTRYSRSCISV